MKHTQTTSKMPRKKKKKPLLQRFREKVVVPDNSEDCWGWKGGLTSRGYTQILDENGKNVSGHVVSYRLFNGPVGSGEVVRHTCDNPPCTNPRHLLKGTKLDNSRDMVERGRSPRGENNGKSVLTWSQVEEMRRLYDSGTAINKLAKQFGVTSNTAWNVVHHNTWVASP